MIDWPSAPLLRCETPQGEDMAETLKETLATQVCLESENMFFFMGTWTFSY